MRDFLNYLRESEGNRGRSGATLNMQAGQDGVFSLAESGFRSVAPKDRSLHFEARMSEARRLVDRVLRGDRYAAVQFSEAMTMSDFGTYFSNILDRSVLANYAETPYSWPAYAKRGTLRDFRQAQIFRSDKGAGVLDGPILPNSYGASGTGPTGLKELTEYPMRNRAISNYTDQIYKFGALMAYSWEAMVNDDLDLLRDTPELFGRAARRTEEQRATQLFVSSTGPNATFFSTANGNLLSSVGPSGAGAFPWVTTINAPLSIASLAWAQTIMASHLDQDGMPLGIEGLTLAVPPALDLTARNIVNATQILMNDMGGVQGDYGSGATANAASLQRLITENWARGAVKVVVNYFLPIVNTTSGNTAWYLFANPSNGRPAMRLSFLQGHEAPELFMKASNAVRIGGGGEVDPMQGDFDYDEITYKVRHLLGGTLLDPFMAVASTGAGS